MRRRRTRTFATVATAVSLAAIAVACGIDAVATKDIPGPDPTEAGSEVSLPPKPEGGIPDAAPDVDADSAVACPTTGGAMVIVDAGGVPYCIDATEVTTADYEKFVGATDGGRIDSKIFDAGTPVECAFNTTYTRVGGTPGDPADLPATKL